jgi:hypothetical protein
MTTLCPDAVQLPWNRQRRVLSVFGGRSCHEGHWHDVGNFVDRTVLVGDLHQPVHDVQLRTGWVVDHRDRRFRLQGYSRCLHVAPPVTVVIEDTAGPRQSRDWCPG